MIIYLLILNARANEDFFLAPNGVTVVCTNANFGDTGIVNGITYTKRSTSELENLVKRGYPDKGHDKIRTSTSNSTIDKLIESTCTSGVESLNRLFFHSTFNGDISTWDTSHVVDMKSVFQAAENFNQDISKWDTSNATYMAYMFFGADSFNQDLSGWCVSNFKYVDDADRDNFSSFANIRNPKWGSCPSKDTLEKNTLSIMKKKIISFGTLINMNPPVQEPIELTEEKILEEETLEEEILEVELTEEETTEENFAYVESLSVISTEKEDIEGDNTKRGSKEITKQRVNTEKKQKNVTQQKWKAHASALGLSTQNGLYQNKAYYYRSDGKQGFDSQMNYSTGLGIDVLLGNRNDKLQGLLRLGWCRDFPASNPDFTEEEGYEYTFPDYETLTPTDVGVTSIGLQWTIWGDPTGVQAMATTSLSSTFWTPQSTEYFLIDVGLGGSYTVQDRFQTYATINFAPRYRKALTMGLNTYVGARVLFD